MYTVLYFKVYTYIQLFIHTFKYKNMNIVSGKEHLSSKHRTSLCTIENVGGHTLKAQGEKRGDD